MHSCKCYIHTHTRCRHYIPLCSAHSEVTLFQFYCQMVMLVMLSVQAQAWSGQGGKLVSWTWTQFHFCRQLAGVKIWRMLQSGPLNIAMWVWLNHLFPSVTSTPWSAHQAVATTLQYPCRQRYLVVYFATINQQTQQTNATPHRLKWRYSLARVDLVHYIQITIFMSCAYIKSCHSVM